MKKYKLLLPTILLLITVVVTGCTSEQRDYEEKVNQLENELREEKMQTSKLRGKNEQLRKQVEKLNQQIKIYLEKESSSRNTSEKGETDQ